MSGDRKISFVVYFKISAKFLVANKMLDLKFISGIV